MNKFLKGLLQVNGNYDLKRVLALVFAIAILVCWIAQQFFSLNVPEFVLNSLVNIFKMLLSDNS